MWARLQTTVALVIITVFVYMANTMKAEADGIVTTHEEMSNGAINHSTGISPENLRYPHCIVWTPIPMLTWLFPIIGHMGIATSSGIIRDFAGPYYVSENNMAFGNPTKYWQLRLDKVGVAGSTREAWDRGVHEASEEYKGRMHNLCCDNCHSHVAFALNTMKYEGSTSWNMFKLCFLLLIHGRYVSFCGVLKTWLPFTILLLVILSVVLALNI